MADKRIQTFEAFWPYYVGEHRDPTCRVLHYIGSSCALVFLALTILVSPWFLLAGVVSGYAFAWIGHFFVEKNKPATFTYPLWSLAADWKMYGLFITGKMAAEVTRLYGSAAPSADAPLRSHAG